GFVPHGREAKDGPGITRAQRADDEVVHLGRVLDDDHVLALHPTVAKFSDSGVGVSKKTLLVGWVGPGASNDAGAITRADFVLVGVDERIERGAVNQTFLDQERFESFDTEREVGRNGLMIVIMSVSVGRFRHSNSYGR